MADFSDLGTLSSITPTGGFADLGEELGDNPLEHGFFGRIVDSFQRGQNSVLANVGVYNAMIDPTEDLEGALIVRRKTRLNEALNPIEGGLLSDLIYAAAKTSGQLFEAAKRGGAAGLAGAAAGGIGGAVVGVAIPTIGEEAVTVGTGARVGFKFASAAGSTLFAYKEGVGGMFAEMVESGVNPDIAQEVAHIAGIPYALIETLQLKGLTLDVKKKVMSAVQAPILEVLAKAFKTYGTTLGKEVAEELGQEIIQISAEKTAKELQREGIHVSPSYLRSTAELALNTANTIFEATTDKETQKRLYEVGKGALKGFALLPLPGAALEAGIGFTANDITAEMEAAKKAAESKSIIKVEDVNTPAAKLDIALEESLVTYAKQQKLRGKEKGVRAGQVRRIRREFDKGDWLYEAKRALKGQYTKLGITPLKESLPVESYEILNDEIRTNQKLSDFEAVKLADALKRLYEDGEIFRDHEIEYARKAWGDNIANKLKEMKQLRDKGGESFIDYLSLPKATAASMDLSRTGRQNITMIGSPKIWFKGLVRDWNLLLRDESTARTVEKDMLTRLDEAGGLQKYIRWNRWGEGAGYITGTERFASKIAGEVPGVKRSERAYALGGNLIRGEKMLQIAEQRKGRYTSDKQWNDLGHVVDILTGEGDAKRLGRLAPALNAVFFAPRLLEARVRTFTDILNPSLSWAARKILVYHMTSAFAVNMGILGSMSLVPGVHVERDWRSTDFGKIRIGKQRIDFWGGYLPIARLFMRLASGEIKTQAGRVIPAEWRDTLITFFQSKLGPAPAYALDVIRGQTFYGDYVGLDANSTMEQFWHRFIPFVIQDIMDAIRYQGFRAGARALPLGFFGVGVQTYPASPGAQLMQYKNRLSMQVFGERWDDLGQDIQDYMRTEFPDVEIKERQYAFDRTNFDFLSRLAQQREKTRKKLYNALPADVRQELDAINVPVSGISRKIAQDWFLNEQRFDEYFNTTKKLYKEVLTNFVRSNLWKEMPAPIRVEIINRIMEEIKAAARQQIVNKAQLEDLERIQRL